MLREDGGSLIVHSQPQTVNAADPAVLQTSPHPILEVSDVEAWADLADPFAAAEFLGLARRIPELADALAGSSPLPIAQFPHFPIWRTLADRILKSTRAGESLHRSSDERLALASLARSIAAFAEWGKAEPAYWHSLMQTHGPRAAMETLFTASLPERCHLVAERLWAVAKDNEVSHQSQLLDQLARYWPKVRWGDVWVEVCDAYSKNNSDKPAYWTEAMRRQLASVARRLAERQEKFFQQQLLRIAIAGSREDWSQQAASVLASGTPEGSACWVKSMQSTRNDASPLGWGVYASGSRLVCYHGTREDFEASALPTSFRHAVPLTEGAADSAQSRESAGQSTMEQRTALGWLYAPLPFAKMLDGLATEQLGPALANWVLRDGLKQAASHEHAALHQITRTHDEQFEIRFADAMAEFGAGAGHMINNPLATIAGKAQWLLAEESDPTRRQALHKIEDQVARVHRMIRDLHFVGKPNFDEPGVHALVTLLRQAIGGLGETALHAEITLIEPPPEWELWGSGTQLSRMVTEVVRNGIEAAGTDGRVRVEAHLVRTGEESNSPRGDRTYCITISDSGPGFNANERRQAFDPFYAGRPAGRGMGMGLTVALCIARHHGGRIELGLGRPTQVRLFIPAASTGEAYDA